MKLSECSLGKMRIIKSLEVEGELKKHLENMGFVPGSTVVIKSESKGNLIVNIKNTNIALSSALAELVIV